MKKLFVILYFLPIFASAQDTIKIPTRVAKQIVTELAECDSVKGELDFTQKELTLTKTTLATKNLLLTDAGLRITNYTDQLKAQKELTSSYRMLHDDLKIQYTSLLIDTKKRKVTRTWIDIIGTLVIGGLLYISVTR